MARSEEVLDNLTAAMVAMIQGLGLVNSNQVSRKMLPHVAEGIDTPPCIQVCPGDPEEEDTLHFEGGREVIYPVEVDIIAAVNRDYVSMLATFMSWRRQLKNLFIPAGVAPACPTIWKVRWSGQPLFDRGQLAQNYGYIGQTFRFTSAE